MADRDLGDLDDLHIYRDLPEICVTLPLTNSREWRDNNR